MINWFAFLKKSQLRLAPIKVIRKNAGGVRSKKRYHVIEIPTASDLVKMGVAPEDDLRSIIDIEKTNNFNSLARLLGNRLADTLYPKLPSSQSYKVKNADSILRPSLDSPRRKYLIDSNPIIINELIRILQEEDLAGLVKYYDISDLLNLQSDTEAIDNVFKIRYYVSFFNNNLYFTFYSIKMNNRLLSNLLSIGFKGGWPKPQKNSKFNKYTFKKEVFSPEDVLRVIDLEQFVDLELSDKSYENIINYFRSLPLSHDEAYDLLKYISQISYTFEGDLKEQIISVLTERLNIDDVDETLIEENNVENAEKVVYKNEV